MDEDEKEKMGKGRKGKIDFKGTGHVVTNHVQMEETRIRFLFRQNHTAPSVILHSTVSI